MSWKARLFGPGVVSNIGANGFSLLAQIFIQLAAVPVLAHSWGLEHYGVWLILLAIPAYLASGDFGFQGVIGTEMTALVARDERERAVVLFQALIAAMLIFTATIGIALALAFAGPLRDLFAFARAATEGQPVTAATVMLAYGLVIVLYGLCQVALRSTGAYAKFQHAYAATVLAENAAVLVLAVAGGSVLDAAWAFLAVRVAATAVLVLIVRHHAGWLLDLRWRSSLRELRGWIRPALALAILPLGNTLSIQSMAPVIAAAGSVSMVPVFTAVRTLTRFAVQLTAVVSTAVTPNFTVALAQGDRSRQADLAALTITTSAAILLPFCAGLLVLGPWFMEVWSAGAIVPPYLLLAALAAAMLANGIWTPLSNLIVATNRHEGFTYVYLACAVAMLALTYALVRAMGVAGAGLAGLMLEIVMGIWILRQARRMDLLAGAGFRQAPSRTIALLRERLGR